MNRDLRALALAAGVALAVGPSPAFAGAGDYVFEPVKVDVKNGPGSELAVRLMHKPTGKPVKDAIVFRTRLDMSPDAMEAMTAKHEALPSSEPGIYRSVIKIAIEHDSGRVIGPGWEHKFEATASSLDFEIAPQCRFVLRRSGDAWVGEYFHPRIRPGTHTSEVHKMTFSCASGGCSNASK